MTDTADVSGALAVINETLLKCKIFRFSADERVEFSLPQVAGVCEEDLRTATRLLIDSEALPDRGMRYMLSLTAVDAQQLMVVFRRIQELGLVDCFGEAVGSAGIGGAWAFTQRGVDVVHPMYFLRNPESVLKLRGLPDLAEWARFELMTCLSKGEWVMLPWPARSRPPPPLSAQGDGAELVAWQGYGVRPSHTWYFRPHLSIVPFDYLRAMVAVEQNRDHFVELNAGFATLVLGATRSADMFSPDLLG